MIDSSEVREDDETYMNPIDRLFEALERLWMVVNVFFSFEVSDRFYQTNSILQRIRIISYLKIMIKRMSWILKNTSREKAKLSLIEIH